MCFKISFIKVWKVAFILPQLLNHNSAACGILGPPFCLPVLKMLFCCSLAIVIADEKTPVSFNDYAFKGNLFLLSGCYCYFFYFKLLVFWSFTMMYLDTGYFFHLLETHCALLNLIIPGFHHQFFAVTSPLLPHTHSSSFVLDLLWDKLWDFSLFPPCPLIFHSYFPLYISTAFCVLSSGAFYIGLVLSSAMFDRSPLCSVSIFHNPQTSRW